MGKSNQSGWPYHLYTGNDPRKQGSYVKCKNNPCLIHGGTDIIASSPEDAYEKANANNSWGFNASMLHASKTIPTTPVFSNADESTHAPQFVNSNAHLNGNAALMFSDADETKIMNNDSGTIGLDSHDSQSSVESIIDNDADDSMSSDVNDMSSIDLNSSAVSDVSDMPSNADSIHDNGHDAGMNANVDSDGFSDASMNVSTDAGHDGSDEIVESGADKVEEGHSDDWLAVHKYENEDERKLIAERDEYLKNNGLYVYDSPLFHRISSKTTPYQLAEQVFPGVVKSQDIGGELWERSNDVYDNLNKSMKAAFKTYTNTKFTDINRAMRGVDMLNDKNTLSKIRLMKRAMTKTKGILQQDTVFYRRRFIPENSTGVYSTRGKEELSFYRAVAAAVNDYKTTHGNVDNHAVNADSMSESHADVSSQSEQTPSEPVVSRPNFLSTSAGGLYYDSDWHNACSFIIKAPAGTRGMYMVDSRHGTEREFLIDGGYDYKVVGIYETGDMVKRVSDDSFYFNKKPVIALEIIPRESNYQYDKTKPLNGSLT